MVQLTPAALHISDAGGDLGVTKMLVCGSQSQQVEETRLRNPYWAPLLLLAGVQIKTLTDFGNQLCIVYEVYFLVTPLTRRGGAVLVGIGGGDIVGDFQPDVG